MKQLAPAATLVPQVLVWAKSAAWAPVIAMLVMSTPTVPSLVSVICIGRLLVPSGWLPKLMLAGASFM